jgi:lincosamide nucleotidyltransferase A/C/D/E
MKSETVIEILSLFEANGLEVWVDGGWGVDALLQHQTRKHDDLDIVVPVENCEEAISLLEGNDYSLLIEDESKSWNFVLSDGLNAVDFHVVNFAESGEGIYGPPERGMRYPDYAFGTKGKIAGKSVKCLSPEYQLESHSGYALKEKDLQDIRHLCRKFGLNPPEGLAD